MQAAIHSEALVRVGSAPKVSPPDTAVGMREQSQRTRTNQIIMKISTRQVGTGQAGVATGIRPVDEEEETIFDESHKREARLDD